MKGPISKQSVVAATDHQVSSDFLDGEVILLDVHDGTYYGLNPVGARIWSMVQTPMQVADIIEALLGEYDVTEERCFQEVSALLGELAARNLVTIQDGPA